MAAVGRTSCALSDFDWGFGVFEEDWPRYQRSVLRQSAFMSGLAHGSRLRMRLNRHVIERRSDDPARLVRADLQALRELPESMAAYSVTRAEARIAHLAGKPEHPPLPVAAVLLTVVLVAGLSVALAWLANPHQVWELICVLCPWLT